MTVRAATRVERVSRSGKGPHDVVGAGLEQRGAHVCRAPSEAFRGCTCSCYPLALFLRLTVVLSVVSALNSVPVASTSAPESLADRPAVAPPASGPLGRSS